MAYAFQTFRTAFLLMQGSITLATNMVGNANVHLGYLGGTLDGSTGNPTLAQIAAMMNVAANGYLSVLNSLITWATNNNAAATAACQLLGTTLAAANTDVTALKNAATALLNADKSTVVNAQTACNNLIAAVPAVLSSPF